MIRLLILSTIFPAALAACRDQSAAPARSRKRPIRAGSSAPASDHSQEQKVCKSLLRQFATVLDAGGACKEETDCTCYSGLMDCGGVTDGRTARRLGTIIKLFRFARCTRKVNCAARSCRASCVAGRCIQTEIGARQPAKLPRALAARREPDANARPHAAHRAAPPRPSPAEVETATRRRRAMINARHRAMLARRDRPSILVKLYATDW